MGGCCATEPGPSETEFDAGCVMRTQRRFVIRLVKRADEGLGLDVDIGDDVTASITNVLEEGVVPSWNKQNAEDLRVQEGDHIVEVNGFRGSASDLLATIKTGSNLEVVIQRPTVFLAAITKEKDSDTIGLEVGYTKNVTTLLVQKVVTAGCVAKWNEAHPASAVRTNDRIVEVNGTRGNSSELMNKITAKDTDLLRIMVSRCE